VLGVFLGLAAAPALSAHTDTPPALPAVWTAWNWHPVIVGSLGLTAWLYMRGVRVFWHTATLGYGIRRQHLLAFWGGWLALGLALVSPLHALGTALFSAHMLQHEVLMLVAAPLLVFGRPLRFFLWVLPLPWRRRVGKWGKSIQPVWHTLTYPLVAWTIHAIALWVWHVPQLFQATLTSELVHAGQHLSFLGSALCFWWAIIHRRQGYGIALLAVFTTALHSSMLGVLLTVAIIPWYPAYTQTTAVWGLTPLEDQQLGGVLMWVPAGMLYTLAALVLVASWLYEVERQMRRQKGAMKLPDRATSRPTYGERCRRTASCDTTDCGAAGSAD
jgi:putative membrane protein